jgi:tellurite methyltransferase
MPLADREKWDAKYAAAADVPTEPSAVLLTLTKYLPPSGRALDVAGGAGRNTLWLAARGLEVTIWDVSPTGLALAQQRAQAADLDLQTVEIDLETAEQLPGEYFDVILSVCYLYRPLLVRLPDLLAPGGTLIVIQPTLRNLERNDKPPAAYLLGEGELPRLVPGLDMLHYEEGWLADGRHDAVVVARKPDARKRASGVV